jgi:stage III sporulation protein AG
LIFISSYIDFDGNSKKEDEGFSVTTYSTEIEKDLQRVISKIKGAGETNVLLTMENSVEYVYLDDSTTKTKEIEPVIRGVLVVCEGGDDPVVVERITDAVTKALDISTAKVCITKLSE